MTTENRSPAPARENIGAQMANVMFNMAQRAGHTLTSDEAALFDRLRKQWDAATPAPAPAVPAGFVLVPVDASPAMLRPFYECPPEELTLAWRAALLVAAAQARRSVEPKVEAPVAGDTRPAAWLRSDGLKAITDDEKSAWAEAGKPELVEDYTIPLTAPQAPQRPVLWVDPAELETLRRHGVGSIDAWASESGEATQGLYTLAPQRANQRTPEGRNVGNELLRLARKHEPLSHDFQAILQMAARGLGADGDAPELVELVPQQAELTDEQILDVVTKIDPGHQYLPRALQQLARAVIAADRALRTPGMADGHDQHAIAVELAATYAAERDLLARDAARYRLLRRGLLWSVIDGAGDVIWSDTLDGALDLVLAGQSHQKVTGGNNG